MRRSDWAFFAISLALNSDFHQKYDGDYFQVRDASFIFNIIGLLVWVPDMVGFKYRVADAKESGANHDDFWRTFPQKITMFVFLFEDIPQIVITCIYFGTMGFDDAGGVAVFAFTMSLLSLLLNGQVFVQEMMKHPDSFTVGWTNREGVGALMVIGASFWMGLMFTWFAWAGMSEEASVLEVMPWGYTCEIKQKIYDDGDGQKEFTAMFIGAKYGTYISNVDRSECTSGDILDFSKLSGGCADMDLGTILGWQLFFSLSTIVFGCGGSCCAEAVGDDACEDECECCDEGGAAGVSLLCIVACSILGVLASTIAAVAVFDQECYSDLAEYGDDYGDEYEDVGNLYKRYSGHGIAFKLEALALTLFLIAFGISCCGRFCGLSVDESFA